VHLVSLYYDDLNLLLNENVNFYLFYILFFVQRAERVQEFLKKSPDFFKSCSSLNE
jgi:hypothetical protein